ncbi:MAG: MgtC/SapB family protein [Reyranella sp.]|uniref:MgtC/SapB family protein n=1 Tax=Reyranella sp. TaxID=1929291 RepID=UPI003D133523
MGDLHPLALGFLVALGIGLLVGIDRERRKGDGSTRSAAGLRTFTLASLLGAVAMAAGGALLLAAASLAVAGFAGVSYWRAHEEDPGLTTETALVVTTLIGGLAIREPAIAAGLGVVVAVLLAARTPLHRFTRSVLTDDELRSLLIFAGSTLVVLPLLPDHPIGPYGALNLRNIWLVVILVMGVSALGYVAVRLAGAKFGLPLAGLAAGFVSSSVTIGAMGERTRGQPELTKPAVAGAVLSSVATIVQLAILIGAISMETLGAFWLPLVLSGVTAIVYGGIFTLWALEHRIDQHSAAGSAFSLKTALAFATILAAILLAAAAAQDWFGETGVLIAAAIGGFADTHSAAVSVASLVQDQRISSQMAIVPILAALTTNTLTKAAFAITTGGRAFALYVIPGLILMVVAAWLGAFIAGPLKV